MDDIYDNLYKRTCLLIEERNKILANPIKYYLDKFFTRKLIFIDFELDIIERIIRLFLEIKLTTFKMEKDNCDCGGEYISDGLIYTSMPPQYRNICNKCYKVKWNNE
jgi:hypothetical protein